MLKFMVENSSFKFEIFNETSAVEDFEAGETVLFCARGFVASATATWIKKFSTFGQPCFAGAV